ncbi:hypothetical protein [Weissella confusa]|uniref:hypothetical protein n=1 Tax=Weissella confusa TaxID=1583 RepID=UPI0022E409CD|nr:hypothetical protein [Weissella confusa]
MFNKDLREAAQNRLKKAAKNFEKSAQETQQAAANLYEVRMQLKGRVDQSIEVINRFKNTPYELSTTIEKIKVSMGTFDAVIREATKDAHHVDAGTRKNIATGVMVGTGVAALAPTAAMGIATTFGVASTGTAISALSGAAATNAALAWLGGGALAAGGAGVAGGEALLALAGPLGWAIGGAALVGGGLLANGKNKRLAEEANEKTAEITSHIRVQNLLTEEIRQMKNLTKNDLAYLTEANLKVSDFGTDYATLATEEKQILGSFVNNVNVATNRLNAIIGERGYSNADKKKLENTNLDNAGEVKVFGGTKQGLTVNDLSDAYERKITFNGKISRLSLLDEPGLLTVNFSKIEITNVEGTSSVVRKPFYAVTGITDTEYFEAMNHVNDHAVHSFSGTVEIDEAGRVYLRDVQ